MDRRLGIAALLALVAGAPAQERLSVWTPWSLDELRQALATLALHEVDVTEVGDDAAHQRLAACEPARRPDLLLGHDSLVLARIAAGGLLAAAPTLPWRDPWVLAAGPRHRQGDREPRVLDDLLFDPGLRQEYVVPRAELAPSLWAGLVAQQFERGRDEENAFAWLRTFEAHSLAEYASDQEAALALSHARVRFAVVLRSRLVAMQTASAGGDVRQAEAQVALPRKALGYGIPLGHVAGAAATEARTRLLSAEGLAKLAGAARLELHAGAGGAASAPSGGVESGLAREPDASRWLARWTERERGKGRSFVSFENAFDIVACVLFAGFLIYAYRRLGRGAARKTGS